VSFSYFICFYYSSAGASTGQTPAHDPQLIQADASIVKQFSPCDIHPTGHSAAQAPQLIHFSQSILYAILFHHPSSAISTSILVTILYF